MSTTTMHKATSITIHRAEGRPEECITIAHDAATVPNVWEAAEATLWQWSRTAPKTGGYDKCDFRVTYDDGEVYEGRLDIKHPSCADHDLSVGDHMRAFLECYALRRIPAHYAADPDKTAAFRRHVLEDCADTHRAAGTWLDSYEIGGAS